MKTSLNANKNIIEEKKTPFKKVEVKNHEAFLLAVNTWFTVLC